MGELVADPNQISPIVAILWCFYPMAALVLIELFLRALNGDDDDDQDGGKMIPVTLPTGA
tara:strand:- start:1024 stop:1203 length:180 start_codon:yes stop_codon:yes gene_type:complete